MEAGMQRLTHQDTLSLGRVLRMGDQILLPWICSPPVDEALTGSTLPIQETADTQTERVQLELQTLQLSARYYRDRCAHRREPSWSRNLPVWQLARLRYDFVTKREDPLIISGTLPFTGFSYMVREGGLCERTVRLFSLWRLQGIRQLGFLQSPTTNDKSLWGIPISHAHRYQHSLDVALLAGLIGRNLRLSRRFVTHLIVAGLTHDFCTPAGGDSVKWIDPKAFDEDANYQQGLKALPQEGWTTFRRRYRISDRLLVQTILNQGLLGSILDLADKLAYVSRDLVAALSITDFDKGGISYVGAQALQEVLERFPYVCSIWDSVEVVQGRLTFLDPERLLGFLKARAILFRTLYYHPRARVIEGLVSQLLVKHLYQAGVLSRDKLLQMADHELNNILDEYYGSNNIHRLFSANFEVKPFLSRPEAIACRQALQKDPTRLVLLMDHLQLRRVGSDLLVKNDREVKPLSVSHPADTLKLQGIAATDSVISVVCLSHPLGEFEHRLATLLGEMED